MCTAQVTEESVYTSMVSRTKEKDNGKRSPLESATVRELLPPT